MPADPLRALVNKRDRANARPHRLTGEPVLPERSEQRVRRVCSTCWHVVDEVAEYDKWKLAVSAKCGKVDSEKPLGGKRLGFKHWHAKPPAWIDHQFPGVSACPACGNSVLDEVQG